MMPHRSDRRTGPGHPAVGHLLPPAVDEGGLLTGQVAGLARHLAGVGGVDLEILPALPQTWESVNAGRGRRRSGSRRHTGTGRAGRRASPGRTRPPPGCRCRRAASSPPCPATACRLPPSCVQPSLPGFPGGIPDLGGARAVPLRELAPPAPALPPRPGGWWRAGRRPGPGSRSWPGDPPPPPPTWEQLNHPPPTIHAVYQPGMSLSERRFVTVWHHRRHPAGGPRWDRQCVRETKQPRDAGDPAAGGCWSHVRSPASWQRPSR